jgi:hypothetical protein
VPTSKPMQTAPAVPAPTNAAPGQPVK